MQNLFAAAHHAADVRAHLHVVLPPRLGGQHRVVADHVPHFEFGQIESRGDLRDDFVGQESDLVLRIQQSRHQRRPLRRIMRHHFRKPRLEFIREFHIYRIPQCPSVSSVVRKSLDHRGHRGSQSHRSISPSTISIDPMAATTSASRRPSHIVGSVCRFAKQADRICTRYGLAVPSLTM